MIRFYEKQDKEEILKLVADFKGIDFDTDIYSEMLDRIADGNEMFKAVCILHAGEYLGYCFFFVMERTLVINQLYIKPAFQKLKVAPQVFDFIEENFPDYTYRAVCPADNNVAIKVFSKRGYEVLIK